MLLGGRYQVGQARGKIRFGPAFDGMDTQDGRPVTLVYCEDAQPIELLDRAVRQWSDAGEPYLPLLGHTTDARGGRSVCVFDSLAGGALVSTVVAAAPLAHDDFRWLAGELLSLIEREHGEGRLVGGGFPATGLLVMGTQGAYQLRVVPDLRLSVPAHAGVKESVLGLLAPEELDNPINASEASDVYALGVLLYEVLTGRLPYVNAKPRDLIMKILAGSYPPVRELRPDVPPAWAQAVETALATDVSERHSSAAAFRAALFG